MNEKAKRYIIAKARLAWRFYDEARKECLQGTLCAMCSGKVAKKDKRADHISPVVDPKRGFVGWEEFYDRLFCGIKGLQLLHSKCHDIKTQKENQERRK